MKDQLDSIKSDGIKSGMAIAAAILVREFGSSTHAMEILGAIGVSTAKDLDDIEIEDYDRTPLLTILGGATKQEARRVPYPDDLVAAMQAANAEIERETEMVAQLRTKANMIKMGERIAFGSDADLMLEAADLVEEMTQRLNEMPK